MAELWGQMVDVSHRYGGVSDLCDCGKSRPFFKIFDSGSCPARIKELKKSHGKGESPMEFYPDPPGKIVPVDNPNDVVPLSPSGSMTMLGSSPMKMAESAGKAASGKSMSIFDTQAFGTYISKYVDTATGGRVKLYGRTDSMLVFKCSSCKDNWHIGFKLFVSPIDGTLTGVPKELIDWLAQHEHVCKTFNNGQADPTKFKCQSCGWAYHRHKEAAPVYDQENGVWLVPKAMASAPAFTAQYQPAFGIQSAARIICVVCGGDAASKFVPLCPPCLDAAKRAKEAKDAPVNLSGRKFRLPQKETKTESEDTPCISTQVSENLNSPDSSK